MSQSTLEQQLQIASATGRDGTDAELTDLELVRRARTDPDAFACLYRRYLMPVYRYCYSYVNNVADAEDLAAQVFTDVWEALPNYRPRHGLAVHPFAAWLFTIARHRISDHFRAHKTDLVLDPERDSIQADSQATLPQPLAAVIHDETLHRLSKLLADLTDDERELLRLRFAAELAFRDIARVLGKSEGAVKMALYRLVARLSDRWEERYDE